MAKDLSTRGGARPGAGRKKKALADKVLEGKTASVVSFPDLPEPPEFDMTGIPAAKDYLSKEQKMGELHGKEIYDEVYKWLAERDCAKYVSPQLVEQYSMAMGRYIQLENIISQLGFLARHPTTGAGIGSMFIPMAHGYFKLANSLFQQIWRIVCENSTEVVTGNPQDALMEKLLEF